MVAYRNWTWKQHWTKWFWRRYILIRSERISPNLWNKINNRENRNRKLVTIIKEAAEITEKKKQTEMTVENKVKMRINGKEEKYKEK